MKLFASTLLASAASVAAGSVIRFDSADGNYCTLTNVGDVLSSSCNITGISSSCESCGRLDAIETEVAEIKNRLDKLEAAPAPAPSTPAALPSNAIGNNLAIATFRWRRNNRDQGFIKGRVCVSGADCTPYLMICENVEMTSRGMHNYAGAVAFGVQASSGQTLDLQWQQNGGGNYQHYTDANGNPQFMSANTGNPVLQGSQEATQALDATAKTMQSVELPSGENTQGSYLVIANWRLRHDGDSHWFIKNQLNCDQCSWLAGEDSHAEGSRMLMEGLGTESGNFNNMGGMSSWIVKKEHTSGARVDVLYDTQYSGATSWYNDANGVPSVYAVKAEHATYGTHNPTISSFPNNQWTSAQTITAPSTGKFLVLVNYRIRINGDSDRFLKMRLNGEERMVVESLEASTPSNFINYGGSQAFEVTATSGQTFSADYYPAGTTAFGWHDDSNGRPRIMMVSLEDGKKTAYGDNAAAVSTSEGQNWAQLAL
jgi:hypothetical protein